MNDFSAFAFDGAGTLFALDTRLLGANAILNTVDPLTGQVLTSITTNVVLGTTAAMAFDPTTGFAYVANGESLGGNLLYRLDTATGQMTGIGSLGLSRGISGLSFTPVAVPEPSASLFGLAGAGFLAVRARRRKAI